MAIAASAPAFVLGWLFRRSCATGSSAHSTGSCSIAIVQHTDVPIEAFMAGERSSWSEVKVF